MATGVHIPVDIAVGVVGTVQAVQLTHDAHNRTVVLARLGGAASIGNVVLHRQAKALKGLFHFFRGTKFMEAHLRMAIDIVGQRKNGLPVLVNRFQTEIL